MERPEATGAHRRRRRTRRPGYDIRKRVLLGMGAIAAIALAAHAAPRLVDRTQPTDNTAHVGPPPPPTRIGLNLFGLNDYYRQQVFTNLIAQSEWFSSRGQGWTAMPTDQLDARGWVRFLRPGQTAPRTLTVPPAPLRPAQIRCTWRGRGTLDTGGIARTISTGADALTLQLTPIGGEEGRGWIELTRTDPADPLRDIDCREIGRPADERFHPEFIEYLRGFTVLRFLDWQRTNDNFTARWDARSTPASSSQVTEAGASIEDMVDLVNRVGADPWFLMPYRADAGYVRAFAQLVHARIDPTRTVYIELGNEVWNDQFEAARQARDEGLAAGLGGGDPTHAQAIRYAQKLCPVMAIWREIFADRPGKLVRVAASHNANPESARLILGHANTAGCVDALATAPYIWIDLERQRVSDPKWVFDRMPAAIDDVFAFAHRNRAIAAEFGKRFIAYEGGQHLVTRDVEFARRVQRDPLMGATYRAYLERWRREMGDDLVLYASTAPIGEYGAWGLREYAGQPTSNAPKLEAVRAFLKAHP